MRVDIVKVSSSAFLHNGASLKVPRIPVSLKLNLLATVPVLLFTCVFLAYPQASPQPKNVSPKAEALPTVDEIAAKCARGSGGKDAWAKISTQVLSGTVEITGVGITGKIEITSKAPDKVFHLFSFADGQFVQKRGFDGRAGWEFDSQKGLKRLEGAQLEDARLEGIFDTEVRLKEVYPDMKVTGRTRIGDRNAYTVLTHAPGGKTNTFYFDAETGLRIAEDSEGPDKNGKTEKSNVLFEDYRAVSGIQIPFRIRVTSPSISLVIQIQEVKHNLSVDDVIFAMPPDSPVATSNASEANKSQGESAAFDPGAFSRDVYTNNFFGFRYQAPRGWTAHGEETNKEIMAVGKSLVDQNTPTGKVIADRSSERTHQLLTLFQYPLGTPEVENQLVQILAEDVRFAPGIRNGKEYLLNVKRVLKAMKTSPEFDDEPKEVTYGGQKMYRADITTKLPTKVVYQSVIATVSKGYAISFAFTSFSAEGRNNLVKTLDSLQFEAPENAPAPH
jgi:hypothetical protein